MLILAQPTAAPAAGFGRIESITALPPSAEGLAVGNRVELTRDGNLRPPAVAR